MKYQLRIALPGLPDIHVRLRGDGPWKLGSSSDSEVPLSARGVSRRHAELFLTPGGSLHFRDLGSTNGTLLAGVRCTGGPAPPGSVLQLGHAVIKVQEIATEALGFDAALEGVEPETLIEIRDIPVDAPDDPCSLEGFTHLASRVLEATPSGAHWVELCRLYAVVLGCAGARCYLLRDDAVTLRASIGEFPDELVSPALARACALQPFAGTFHGKGRHEGVLLASLPVRLPPARAVLVGLLPPGRDAFRLRPEAVAALMVLVRLVLMWIAQLETGTEAIEHLKRRLEELRGTRPANGLRREPILGTSRALMKTLEDADRVAPTGVTVLLLGETGTGKELLARRIHDLSTRAGGPFVPVNCAVLSESQLEAELFGAERGAYTSLDRRRVGRIESAAGGTFFLDEIGDMPERLQAILLRVLEDRVVTPIGGTPRTVDVRFVAATNKDLWQLVEAGSFRRDLYFRLTGATVHLPPLRERTGDVCLLANAFLEAANREFGRAVLGFDEEAVEELEKYSWPGNVRELLATVKSLALAETGPVISAAAVRAALARRHGVSDSPPRAALTLPWAQAREAFEREYFATRLRAHRGSLSALAGEVGITRPNLYVKLRKLGLLP